MLGKLFQIQDDFLDLYASQAVFGKLIGGDILEKKKNFLYVTALMFSDLQQKKRLKMIYDSNDPHKIEKISLLYDKLHVKEYVKKEIQKLYIEILSLISSIEVKDSRKTLFIEFLESLLNRKA